VIVRQPKALVVDPGDSVEFTVEAGASPMPSYQWRINSTNLDEATSASLPLANVHPFDAGDYSVVVSNAFGAVTSAVARLTVVQAAQIASATMTDGAFQLQLAAQPGVQYSIESSTNLLDWELLQTFTATNSPVMWSDTEATNFPLRFYRTEASAP
jgi:hypothetical protein